MKLARWCVIAMSLLLIGGGYLASQSAFFGGTTAEYIKALDTSPVPMLSLVLLIAVVVLAFLKKDTLTPSSTDGGTE